MTLAMVSSQLLRPYIARKPKGAQLPRAFGTPGAKIIHLQQLWSCMNHGMKPVQAEAWYYGNHMGKMPLKKRI